MVQITFFARSTILPLLVVALTVVEIHGQDMFSPGEKIYRTHCASCHGEKGQGTKKYRERLEGDFSVGELAELVRETMPEDKPGSLSHEQSNQVARYVHHTFYSRIARERDRPPRIELARLTSSQYRQATTDLIGSFRAKSKWDEPIGLVGDYVASRNVWDKKAHKKRRFDELVDFDFGTDVPIEEIDDPRTFSIRWSGSIIAPETGTYKFALKSGHACRLFLNNHELPVIDAWVRSNVENEHQSQMFLVGGRAYPVRVEFSKSKQGVDDSKKQKKKPPVESAAISLLWQRPGGILQVVPTRNLTPTTVPVSFICQTILPPDDRSYGWERATSISKQWDRATTQAAIEVAAYVDEHLSELSKSKPKDKDRVKKLKGFCQRFASSAFRQPLTDDQLDLYVERQFKSANDLDSAVRRSVLLVLKSPRFLYREVADGGEGIDSFAVAARLSFALWDSLPDTALAESARKGELQSREQIEAHAASMIDDPRARHKLFNFLLSWTHSESNPEIDKDTKNFAEFDAQAMSDLRSSFELTLSEAINSPAADFRALMLTNEFFANRRLAELYQLDGVDFDEKDENDSTEITSDSFRFRKLAFNSEHRAGVITHPYLLARFANRTESSPIHRGVFLARGILGQTLRPPPEAVTPLAPELHPDLTTRQRVAMQTKSENCMRCHGIINPLGFTLEGFDAVGRLRETERGKPVNTRSTVSEGGEAVEISGGRELAEYLVANENAQLAFCEQLFHFLIGQPIRAYGDTTASGLRTFFVNHQYNIRKLAVHIAVIAAQKSRHETIEISKNTD